MKIKKILFDYLFFLSVFLIFHIAIIAMAKKDFGGNPGKVGYITLFYFFFFNISFFIFIVLKKYFEKLDKLSFIFYLFFFLTPFYITRYFFDLDIFILSLLPFIVVMLLYIFLTRKIN